MEKSNVKAMREALEQIRELLSIGGKPDTAMCIRYEAAYLIAKEALSAPPRNCDVGTAEEQSYRFDKFCYSHSKCHKCPVKSIWNSQHRQKQLREIIRCEIIWSQMQYEEGDAE